jgi:tetratricopeptide (TPR) repeat protein
MAARSRNSRIIVLQPMNAKAWNNRCWDRAVSGALEPALADCNESLRLVPGDPNTMDSRGVAYLKLGQFDKAIGDYDAALARNPRQAGSLYGRGVARLRTGDRDGGHADIAAAAAIQTDIAEEYGRYGVRE